MNDYSKIITTAIRVTVNTPLLWFFGLFLSAGFNANWLFLSRAGFAHSGGLWALRFLHVAHGRPVRLLLLIGIFGAVLIGGWLLANWVKIVFVYNVAAELKMDRLRGSNQAVQEENYLPIWQKQKKLFGQSRRVLPTVLGLSLFTALTQGIVTFVLSGPLFWERYIAPLPGIVVLATVLFVLFMLFFSLLNFFAALHSSLYQSGFHAAFSFASHLLRTRIKPLFVTCVLLLVLYTAGVIVGLELANVARALFTQVGSQFNSMDIWRSYVVTHPDFIGILFFLWVGFLNALFNVGLCVFFQNFVKPTKFEAENLTKAQFILKVSVDKTV